MAQKRGKSTSWPVAWLVLNNETHVLQLDAIRGVYFFPGIASELLYADFLFYRLF